MLECTNATVLEEVADAISRRGTELIGKSSDVTIKIPLQDGRTVIGIRYEGVIQPHLMSTTGFISESETGTMIARTCMLLEERQGSFLTLINHGQLDEVTIIWEIEPTAP